MLIIVYTLFTMIQQIPIKYSHTPIYRKIWMKGKMHSTSGEMVNWGSIKINLHEGLEFGEKKQARHIGGKWSIREWLIGVRL